MFKQFIKIRILIVIAFSAWLPILGLTAGPALALDCVNPATAQEAQQCGACSAAGISDTNCEASANKSGTNLNNLIHRIINIISVIAAIVGVIMIIVGGFRYITSSGNDAAIGAAKKTILFAVIGLIIVALAQVIARFALTQTTKGTQSGNSSSSSSGPSGPH